MKKYLICLLTALSALFSCSPVGDTVLVGEGFTPGASFVARGDSLDPVHFCADSLGAFTLSLPRELWDVVSVEGDGRGGQLVSDGSRIVLSPGEEGVIDCRSCSKWGVQAAHERLTAELSGVEDQEAYETFLRKHYARNKKNILGLYMLYSLAGMAEPDEGVALIDEACPRIRENGYVQELRTLLQKRLDAEPGEFRDFTVENVREDGGVEKVSLSDYVGKGHPVLVDFWASWCGPCVGEIPNLQEVYGRYGQKGLRVLSIAVWDNPDDAFAAASEHGITWSQIVCSEGTCQVPTETYGVEGIPYIMLFDGEGRLVGANLRGKGIMKAVEKLF